MLPALLTVLFLTVSAYGSPMANQYVDSVLNTALRNELRLLSLDPAALPNFSVNFTDKVAIIGTVKGNADFFQGNMTGLSDVRRYSECQGPYYSFGAKSINCSITFYNLKINYEGKLKYGKVPKVNIKGHANVTNTVIFFEATNQNNIMTASLKNFLFQQNGYLVSKFTGLGPLNKFVKFLENGFRAHVDAQIFNSMSQRFQYALNNAIGRIPLPN